MAKRTRHSFKKHQKELKRKKKAKEKIARRQSKKDQLNEVDKTRVASHSQSDTENAFK